MLVTPAVLLASEHRASTPQEVFDSMKAHFNPEKAKELRVRYQFNLSGPNGGTWSIEVNNGKCRFTRAAVPKPDVTFTATDRDWVALSNGTLNGAWAYVTGRLKISGSHALARKLDELF